MKTIHAMWLGVAASISLSLAVTGCGLVSASKPVVVIASPPSVTRVEMEDVS